MKAVLFGISLILTLTYMSGKYIFLTSSSDQTVTGISHWLACPCECPMVLEDCHMSCGLSWKNLIGEKLKSGLGKEDIVSYFYKRFGREALLTPAQRVAGKFYVVTRGGYPVGEIALFGVIVLVWTSLIYLILLTGYEKIISMRKK